MTFDERVKALTYLGCTPRQTRFLVTVALHSGFCLRRQFAAFAGIEYGKNVRHFLDRLVTRGLARRLQWEVNRGHVYHLRARAVYRALGQDDNRNRRATAPALVARKLMLLDFVLAQPADEWMATEPDKVALCHERFGIDLAHLPRRVYVPQAPRRALPARYFIDKLPLFLAGDPPTLHFVYLATEPRAQGFLRFLWDHRGVLARVPRWAVVVVYPSGAVDLRPYRVVFDEFLGGSIGPTAAASTADLRWYFQTRRAVEQDDVPTVSTQLIERFHAARRRFAGATFESLYADWARRGDDVLDAQGALDLAAFNSRGQFLTHELPFSYLQFGTLPGVA